MRRIEVYSTEFGDQTKTVEVSENCTLAELKTAIQRQHNHSMSGDNWTCVGRQTKAMYTLAESIISEEDRLVAVYPKKMKAGISDSQEEELLDYYSRLDELKFELRSIIAEILDISEEKVDNLAGVSTEILSENKKSSGFRDLEDDLGLNS